MAGHQGQSGSAEHVAARRRFFTPAEADRALVLVKRIVADITRDYAQLSDLQESMDTAHQTGMYDRAEHQRDRIVEAVERIQAFAKELNDLGAELEDWTLGVVGFPCMAGGREVVLCWQADDHAVEYWHDVDEECGHRRPIHTLPMSPAPAWQTA